MEIKASVVVGCYSYATASVRSEHLCSAFSDEQSTGADASRHFTNFSQKPVVSDCCGATPWTKHASRNWIFFSDLLGKKGDKR